MSDDWISAVKFLISATGLSVFVGGGVAFGIITVGRWMKFQPVSQVVNNACGDLTRPWLDWRQRLGNA